MQVARETSFEDLQKLLLKEMATVVHHQVLCQKQEVIDLVILDFNNIYNDSFFLGAFIQYPSYGRCLPLHRL